MKQKGFTLVEVITVMTLMAVIMAMAGIAYNRWINRYKVESQMKEMYADLMSARVNAMSKNRMYFVVFPAAAGITRYTIYEDTNDVPNGNCTLETGTPSDRQVIQKNLSSSYSMTATTGTQINLTAKGIMVDTAGNLIGSPTPSAIRVTTDYGADYDCINISGGSAINIGKWNAGTNVCDAK